MKRKNIVGGFSDNAFFSNLYKIMHSPFSDEWPDIYSLQKKRKKKIFISSSLSSASQNLVILCNAPKANTFLPLPGLMQLFLLIVKHNCSESYSSEDGRSV